jgi:HEAT repeat protein
LERGINRVTTIGRLRVLPKKAKRSPTAAHVRGKVKQRALMPGDVQPVGDAPAIDQCWLEDIATLRRAAEELVRRRQHGIAQHRFSDFRFREFVGLLDDPSSETRQWAVRKLFETDPDEAATLVNDVLRDGTPEVRRNIGMALADSGLLMEATDDLMDENHERCYGAFSLLFLVAKAGVVQPLINVIEKHPSVDLRLAVIRLLASSKETQVAPVLKLLSENPSIAPEVRAATMRAFGQITGT